MARFPINHLSSEGVFTLEPTTGHNKPPLSELLAETYREVEQAIDALMKRSEGGPSKIDSDEDLDKVHKLVTDARDLLKKAEGFRAMEKEPFIRDGRIVDQFFSVLKDRAERVQKKFQKIGDEHAQRLAREARQKAEDEARRANEEAERQARLAREAEESRRLTSASVHDARSDLAAEKAFQAQAVAEQSSADLVRARTASGGLSSARETWDFTISDVTKIPLDQIRPFLKPEHIEQAVRAFVKINQDRVPLEGVKVFRSTKAAFR